MPKSQLDNLDIEIMSILQENARLSNIRLAEKATMSPPTCLRRVGKLEQKGYIEGYHAAVNSVLLGFKVQVFVMVGLYSQAEDDLMAFEEKCRSFPMIRECYMLNGEIDFILKCVAPDLMSFQKFLTESLTPMRNVANVKTSLVIRQAKNAPTIPFELLEKKRNT